MAGSGPVTIDDFKQAIQEAIVAGLTEYTRTTQGDKAGSPTGAFCACLETQVDKLINVQFYAIRAITGGLTMKELNTTLQSLQIQTNVPVALPGVLPKEEPEKAGPSFWKRLFGGLQGAGDNLASGNRAGTLQDISGLASKVPVIGTALSAISLFGAGLAQTGKLLSQWSDRLHSANMQFAEFSGAMANVQAQSEIRNIQLAMQRGDRRADSADYLARQRDEARKQWAPVEDAIDSAVNRLFGFFEEKWAKLGEVISNALQLKEQKQEEPTGFGNALFQVGLKAFDETSEKYGRPAGFK